MKNVLRLGAVLLVVMISMLGVSALWAAGEDPASAVLLNVSSVETCTAAVTLQPGASMWVKIPYTAGTDVELYAKGSTMLDFSVYFGDQSGVPGYPSLGNPVGRLTPNKNEPAFLASWRGHVGTGNASAFIYVLIKNTTNAPIIFSLCSIQNPQFFPPPMSLPPAPVCDAFPAVPGPGNCCGSYTAPEINGCCNPQAPSGTINCCVSDPNVLCDF